MNVLFVGSEVVSCEAANCITPYGSSLGSMFTTAVLAALLITALPFDTYCRLTLIGCRDEYHKQLVLFYSRLIKYLFSNFTKLFFKKLLEV